MRHASFQFLKSILLPGLAIFLTGTALAHLPAPLDPEARAEAAANYQRYCALCHGDDREGYAADNAPSLRSHSLIASGGLGYLFSATTYGRPGTAMAAYGSQFGGPLEQAELISLVRWLVEESGVEELLSLSREPIKGDIGLGAELYQRDCASCHGDEGEGIDAPALAHPMSCRRSPTPLFDMRSLKAGRIRRCSATRTHSATRSSMH